MLLRGHEHVVHGHHGRVRGSERCAHRGPLQAGSAYLKLRIYLYLSTPELFSPLSRGPANASMNFSVVYMNFSAVNLTVFGTEAVAAGLVLLLLPPGLDGNFLRRI